MDQKKLKEMAIASLEACRKELEETLAHAPMLALQANAVLQRLSNSLRMAAGASPDESKAAAEPQKLTHIAGMPIKTSPGLKRAHTKPSAEKVEDMEFLGGQVIDDIRSNVAPGDVLDKHSEIAIRAAAAMVGLYATPTQPERITGSFIADIFNKIVENDERDRQVFDADQAALAAREAEMAKANAELLEAKKEEKDPEPAKEPAKEDTGAPAKDDGPDEAIAKYNAAQYAAAQAALAAAESARAAIPADAASQVKSAATKVVNEAKKAVDEAKAALDALTTK